MEYCTDFHKKYNTSFNNASIHGVFRFILNVIFCICLCCFFSYFYILIREISIYEMYSKIISCMTATFINAFSVSIADAKKTVQISLRWHSSTSRQSSSGYAAAGKEYKSCTRWPRISNRCLIGDRSGDLSGQARVLT